MTEKPYYCCSECGSMNQDKAAALECHGDTDGNEWFWHEKRAAYFLTPEEDAQ